MEVPLLAAELKILLLLPCFFPLPASWLASSLEGFEERKKKNKTLFLRLFNKSYQKARLFKKTF